jgi:hypothetical protein
MDAAAMYAAALAAEQQLPQRRVPIGRDLYDPELAYHHSMELNSDTKLIDGSFELFMRGLYPEDEVVATWCMMKHNQIYKKFNSFEDLLYIPYYARAAIEE